MSLYSILNNNSNNNNNSNSDKKKINPIIDNLLKDKIDFKLAKHPDKVSIKPSTYKIFKSFKTKKGKSKDINNFDNINNKINNIIENQKMVRPKSMAEAVANYTGKKYNNDNNDLKISKKRKIDNIDQKERLKKILLQQSISQNQIDNDNDNNENDENENDDDDDDSDDDDFHTAESDEDNDNSFSSSISNESESTNSDDNNNNDNDNEEINEDEINSDSIDPLKKDLKDDAIENQQSTETPPTSNNDDDDENKIFKLIDNNLPNNDFYDLNEKPNNHGSNNSTRIDKTWGPFIENHTSLGLLNHGVTCYMNAAIQSLCHIPSLTHYLIDVQKGKYDNSIKPDSVTKVLASTISKMYRIGHNRKTMYINPKKLCKRLEDINCMMSEWQQEDSHEYFMSLMSRLQEDSTPKGVKLNKSIIYDIFGGLLDQTVTCNNCGHISTTQQEFYDLSLGLDNRKKRSSLMVDPKQLYQLKYQIENCNSSTDDEKVKLSKILSQRILLAQDKISNKDQNNENLDNINNNSNNFNNINNKTFNENIEPRIKDESQQSQQQNQQYTQQTDTQSKKYSIENSIRDFFTPEILKTDKRDQSGYVCEKCKIQTNAIKISTIQRSPETLSIHLKRFKFEGQQSQKVKANVTYPEILDLTSFTTDMSTPTRYKLISVIIHQGRSVSSGHYIAHCRQPDGTWATYDDEYINKIPRASALSDPGAYVLIYERLTYKGINKNRKNEEDLTTKKRKLEDSIKKNSKRKK